MTDAELIALADDCRILLGRPDGECRSFTLSQLLPESFSLSFIERVDSIRKGNRSCASFMQKFIPCPAQ